MTGAVKAVGTPTAGTTTTLAVSTPSGGAAGDILVLVATCQYSSSATDWDVSPVSGMARVGPAFTASSSDQRITGMYAVRLTGAPSTSYTFNNPSSGQRCSLVFLLLSGIDSTTMVSGSTAWSYSASPPNASITIAGSGTVSGDLTLQLVSGNYASPNSYAEATYTGGLTAQVTAPSPSGTENTGASRTFLKVWAGSGAVGSHSWSSSGAAANLNSYLVSFKTGAAAAPSARPPQVTNQAALIRASVF